jgi:hypothetical protein
MQKRGQVWVETVTYTLITFIMIGLVLSFVKPKIEEYQDRTLIEQSTKILKEIDQTIREVGESAIGNKRKVEVLLKEGDIEINPTNNSISFIMDSKYTYSEPNILIHEGNLNILTTPKGKLKEVKLSLNYTNVYTLRQDNTTNTKKITKSSNPYNLYISNKGGENREINVEID